jgi:hypothetical protein
MISAPGADPLLYLPVRNAGGARASFLKSLPDLLDLLGAEHARRGHGSNLVGEVVDRGQVTFPIDIPADGALHGVVAAHAMIPAHPVERGQVIGRQGCGDGLFHRPSIPQPIPWRGRVRRWDASGGRKAPFVDKGGEAAGFGANPGF